MSEVDDLGGLASEDEWLRTHIEADLTPAVPEPATETRDTLAAVLAEHVRATYSDRPFTCSCNPHTSDGSATFTAHVAAALAPLVTRIEREAREDERAELVARYREVAGDNCEGCDSCDGGFRRGVETAIEIIKWQDRL